MISAAEALAIIRSNITPVGTTTVAVEHARGLVLAEDVRSEENVPPFDNAAMDGYAVRSDDCLSAPVTLKLIGEVSAGDQPRLTVGRGEAIAVSTGAAVPQGCTAVVQLEWTSAGPDTIIVQRRPIEGQNIRKAGADVSAGALVLRTGAVLRPQEIGVLISLGRQFVAVHRRPRISVLATGSELVDPDKPLRPGAIRNSNAYVLAALISECGAEPRLCGIARDDEGELRSKLADALNVDMLITSGGVSVGRHDLVQETLRELGVEVLFWKVNIKPGMPILFGRRGDIPVFALPGNPVSSMVTFLQFVRPALLLRRGQAGEPFRPALKAKLAEPLSTSDGKMHFLRGVLEKTPDGLIVRSAGSQISNILSSLVRANCLIILPEDRNAYRAGEMVDVELLP